MNNVVIDEKLLDCFATLGICPTKSMGVIQQAYRDSVRMVHPDRAHRLGVMWTPEECCAAFENIRGAYEHLRSQFNEIDLPDYDMVYWNDCDSLGPQAPHAMDEFNRKFEEARGTPPPIVAPKTLEQLLAERDQPIPEDTRPKIQPKDLMVPWAGDPVAKGTLDPMVLGGEEPLEDLTWSPGPTGLDLAYGQPMDGVWGDCYVVAERDYPTEFVEYSDTVEYSKAIDNEIAARDVAMKKLDERRKERFALEN